jgi:ABC-type molybdate transport system substrate-binding protein
MEDKAMRFLYNNQVAVVHTDGKLTLLPEKDVKVKEDSIEKNLKKFSIKNYKEFLALLVKETSEKIEKAYYVMMSEDHVVLAVSEPNSDPYVKAFYKVESKEILDLLKRLLTIENDSGKVVIGNINNDFNFLTSKTILSVLFTAADINSRGEKLYRQFKIKSKNGKVRNIIAPHDDIKKELQNLNGVLQYIFDKINADFQIAYKKDKSIADNAEIHKDKKFVYNVDLKDFYPSCKRELVKKYVTFFFKNSFNGQNTEKEFLDIILHKDALFIGSPISGTLANVIISRPANYIRNIAHKFGMEFSVYADDMTFSSDRFISRKVVENIFNLAFSKYNLETYFTLNEKKFHGMSNNRRRITGVTINHLDQTTVSRGYYRDLRVKIHKLSIGVSEGINLQKLRGKIAFALMIDGSNKIGKLITKFMPTIKTYHLVSDEKLAELKKKGVI